MSKELQGTRREFLRDASFGFGVGLGGKTVLEPVVSEEEPSRPRRDRLPREVWIATLSQNGLRADTPEEMTTMLLERMEEAAPLQPDLVCLPEVAPFANLSSGRPPVEKMAEESAGPISKRFAAYAREHKCYVACGIYTREKERYYNSMVLFDRGGNRVGAYHKIHPTEGEIRNHISPGPMDAPVFQTDFGVVGAQICFDIEWLDGWSAVSRKGAEIVVWPSAYGGGWKLNMLANINRFVLVSSTRKGVSKIVDISGETIAWTGIWDHWICSRVNLEKAFLHSWPYATRFNELRKKYGRDLRITTFHEEEWSILESLSPDLKIADVLREFEIKTYEEMVRSAESAQVQARLPSR